MIAWIYRWLVVIFFGREFLRRLQQRNQPQSQPRESDTNCVCKRTFGMVRFRVFLNRNRDGNPYFKFTINRLKFKDGDALVNSFFPEDLEDIVRCAHAIRAWLRDSKTNS